MIINVGYYDTFKIKSISKNLTKKYYTLLYTLVYNTRPAKTFMITIN